ncbi:MAG: hypothetical protein AAF664_16485 [Planctomycetota bacterium]
MTIDEIRDAWSSQETPQETGEGLSEIISEQNAGMRRQLTVTVLVAVAAFAMGVFNFLGQYFGNGNGLFISVLRSLPVLAATSIHIVAVKHMAKEQRLRFELAASHSDWLRHRIATLESEIRGSGWWKVAAFLAFLTSIVAITKWLDFRSGEDSLSECIAITFIVLAGCSLTLVGVWHHRTQFLIPELTRFRSLEADLIE